MQGRKANPVAQPVPDPTRPEAFDRLNDDAAQLAVIQQQQQEAADTLAIQFGYGGAVTVGRLEDEIRFYQERTVEMYVEVGKRLLLLKELTAHGDFERRVELMGFSTRSARRFMGVAKRVAKSATVAVLAGQVKNVKALLEFMNEDDEVIAETLERLDEIDKKPASVLRAELRKTLAERERMQAVNAELHQEVVALKLKTKSKVVAVTDWPDALQPLAEQVAAAGRKLATAVSELETCRITLFATAQELPDTETPRYQAALGHMAEVYQAALERAERDLGRERVTFDKTLGAFAGQEGA